MLSSFLRCVAEARISETGGHETHTMTHEEPVAAVQVAAVLDALDQMSKIGHHFEPADVQSAIDGVLGPGGQTIRNRTQGVRRRLELNS